MDRMAFADPWRGHRGRRLSSVKPGDRRRYALALWPASEARPDRRGWASSAARAVLDGASTPAMPVYGAREQRWRMGVALPDRLLSHLLVALVAVIALLVPRSPGRPAEQAVPPALAQDPVAIIAAPQLAGAPLVANDLPSSRPADINGSEIFADYHTLVEGETLGSIAQRYRVPVASLFWANGLGSDTLLAAGQELRIPRVAGAPYIVQPGDTLPLIAGQFDVPVEAIQLFRPNHVQTDADLVVGQELYVPGAAPPYPADLLERLGGERGLAAIRVVVAGAVYEDETNLRSGPGRAYPRVAQLTAGVHVQPVARHQDWVKVVSSELGEGWVRLDLIALPQQNFQALPETNDFPPPPPRWVWPASGHLTSSFGWRSDPYRSYHDGLDIANRAGTLIMAARAGRVYEAGWCRGFGYCVKIDHGGGLTTIYGHMLRRPRVASGDYVEAGDAIGLMGSTYDRAGGGYSTGVHLHFTVKVNGKAVNPLKYLP